MSSGRSVPYKKGARMCSRSLKARRGSAMVEQALVFLVLMLVVFGVIEFGGLVFVHNTISAASREGVRYAIVHGANSASPATSSSVSTHVKNWSPGLDPSALTVTTTWSPNKKPGSTVKVQAS